VRATFLGGGDVRPWRWFSSSLRIGLRYWSLVLGVGGVAVDSRPLLSATVLGRARSRRCAAALRLGMRHDVPSRNRNAHFVWASVPPRASCPGAHRRNSPSLLTWWRSSRCEIQWSGRHSWWFARSTLRANARCWVIFLEPLVSAPCQATSSYFGIASVALRCAAGPGRWAAARSARSPSWLALRMPSGHRGRHSGDRP
jgi:hypothetical protein